MEYPITSQYRRDMEFPITSQYKRWEDDVNLVINPGEVRNDRKHKATCLKNKKKRKKRKK
jgi:hypothetical protein